MKMDPVKREWQLKRRAKFKAMYGYSTTSHYATGGLREAVLERDRHSCVRCGMTDEQHKAKWNRPITVDHINKDRSKNVMDNLQTLCLTCHGRKDLLPSLRVQRVAVYKDEIMRRRANGEPYQGVADSIGFSIAAIWKWVKRWEQEDVCLTK